MDFGIHDPFSLAQIVGYIAMSFGIIALLQHCDTRVRFFMASSSVGLALHFLLLGSPAAAAISILSASRAAMSMFHGMRKKARFIVPIYISIIVSAALWNYERWFDILPMLSTCLGTYAYFYWQSPKLRYSLIVGSCLWLVHNILAHSYGPIIMETSLIATNVYRLCNGREVRYRR